MTCGMVCVMRRERRGVLHLDKYSPPKANLFSRKEERKRKRKEKGRKKKENGKKKRTSSSLNYEKGSCSSERIYVSRGRGSLLLWLIFISEP